MNAPDTATLDPKQAEREAIKDINQDYKTKFGFNDPETGYVYKAPKGLSRQLFFLVATPCSGRTIRARSSS